MKKFNFRLQKVLEYREAMEQLAQDAYLDTRVARLEAEASVLEVAERRKTLLKEPAQSLDVRQAIELKLQSLDDEEHSRHTVVEVLKAEEEKAFKAWQEKKRELEALVKLRDKAKEEYELELTRHEQAELDEWAVLKRGA